MKTSSFLIALLFSSCGVANESNTNSSTTKILVQDAAELEIKKFANQAYSSVHPWITSKYQQEIRAIRSRAGARGQVRGGRNAISRLYYDYAQELIEAIDPIARKLSPHEINPFWTEIEKLVLNGVLSFARSNITHVVKPNPAVIAGKDNPEMRAHIASLINYRKLLY